MGLTRRQFLMRVGQAGGYRAAFVMMQSLGLLAIPEASAESSRLRVVDGKGSKVVILGAGIAGLVAALMVLSAATIAAPSAAALASRRERGRSESERCILVFVLFRKCLAEVYVGWRVGV